MTCQANGPVSEFAVSENYKVVTTQKGDLYLVPLKDHVILTSEMVFNIRGKIKHGEAADAVKKGGENWVDVGLSLESLVTVEVKMGPGQTAAQMPRMPCQLQEFFAALEQSQIVRTKVEAHDCSKDAGGRQIKPKAPMVVEVPVADGTKSGRQAQKNIASHVDIGALKQSEHLVIVMHLQYQGPTNTIRMGYPAVYFARPTRILGAGALIQLAAR